MKPCGAIVAAAAVLILAGCSAVDPVTSVEPTPTIPSLQEEPPADNSGWDAEPALGAEAVWDDAARAAAAQRAETVMRAFANTMLSQDEWFAQLSPYLTVDAAQAYRQVSVDEVRATAVIGEATIIDDSSVYLAIVTVPTDAGAYEVHLNRPDGDSEWLAFRIRGAA